MAKQKPFLLMRDAFNDFAESECGCIMQKQDMTGDPEIYLCKTHLAAPALLEVMELNTTYLEESHVSNIENGERISMRTHRREEPECTYCEAIRRAKRLMRQLEGKSK